MGSSPSGRVGVRYEENNFLAQREGKKGKPKRRSRERPLAVESVRKRRAARQLSHLQEIKRYYIDGTLKTMSASQ